MLEAFGAEEGERLLDVLERAQLNEVRAIAEQPSALARIDPGLLGKSGPRDSSAARARVEYGRVSSALKLPRAASHSAEPDRDFHLVHATPIITVRLRDREHLALAGGPDVDALEASQLADVPVLIDTAGPRAVASYENWLATGTRTTRSTRASIACVFSRWCVWRRVQLAGVTAQTVERYFSETRLPLQARNRRLSTLRRLFDGLRADGVIAANPLENTPASIAPRGPRWLWQPLNVSRARKVLRVAARAEVSTRDVLSLATDILPGNAHRAARLLGIAVLASMPRSPGDRRVVVSWSAPHLLDSARATVVAHLAVRLGISPIEVLRRAIDRLGCASANVPRRLTGEVYRRAIRRVATQQIA